jgi:hypothetical protein
MLACNNTKITEDMVVRLWLEKATGSEFLWNDLEISIIYPGRKNSNVGSDLEDAVISVNGELKYGNIEIHVKATDWNRHLHNRDPRYNNVILHVVMFKDNDSDILLENGIKVPTICLKPSTEIDESYFSKLQNRRFCKYAIDIFDDNDLSKLLVLAGERKFKQKAKVIFNDLARDDMEQVLYKHIARSFGYSRNADQFAKLSYYIPINKLLEPKCASGLTKLAAIIGTAGLLPSQRLSRRSDAHPDKYVIELESLWKNMKLDCYMNESDWEFLRVRPGNNPVRRLAGMSAYIDKYKSGLLEAMLNLINNIPKENSAHWIEENLAIYKYDDYWENHIDFGISFSRKYSLVGHSKSRIIVTNVILPFGYAYGLINNNANLRRRIKKLYFEYPAAESNNIVFYMKKLLMHGRKIKLNTIMQQGLIHLFRGYCRTKSCPRCPVSLKRRLN